MTSQLHALCIDAHDPHRLARFWAELLNWEPTDDGTVLTPTDDTGFLIRCLPTQETKYDENTMHFDLTSTSDEHQRETVARALELGARHLDIGQGPDATHTVLADPEGNEFCVLEAGNKFLAECGFVGALASDGSQAVGYFWSKALGWPLVWDQDEETAIRSPHGGPKITWGGPPLMSRNGRIRLHYDLAPPADGDQQAEIERLIGLGATRLDSRPHETGGVVLADPDGNEFCVLTPR
ncbi:VOC family protein [Nonomuraea sp. NPDC048826]|uniref:VOC family protein n=1 Tax=Nonomuraea sp. NPDC048826 TaxID=3364347 RepID=UPI00371AE0EE